MKKLILIWRNIVIEKYDNVWQKWYYWRKEMKYINIMILMKKENENEEKYNENIVMKKIMKWPWN